jgi:hypothetical protein
MRASNSTAIGVTVAAALLGTIASSMPQSPAVRSFDESILREYVGVYQWQPNAFVYLQMWNEFAGTNQLVAFDESGEVRTLYPTDRDRFFAGPGAAIPASIESQIEFQRDGRDRIASLTWRRGVLLHVSRDALRLKRTRMWGSRVATFGWRAP